MYKIKKSILIFSQYPNQRIKKIALVLRKKYNISLLCCEDGWNDSEYNKLFDNIYFVTSIDKNISLLKKENNYYNMPFLDRKQLYKNRDIVIENELYTILKSINSTFNIVYLFVASLNHKIPAAIIDKTNLPYIYDNYDLTMLYGSDLINEHFDSQANIDMEFINEKYCITNASAIVSKFSSECYYNIYDKNYNINNKTILEFKDYTIDENFIDINYNKSIDNTINIALAGIIKDVATGKSYSGDELHQAIELINSKSLLFDIYTESFGWGDYKSDFSSYYKLENAGFLRNNGYLEYLKLINQISIKSHFTTMGLPNVELMKKNNSSLNLIKYTIGNRIATSLESGIPIIGILEFEEYHKEITNNGIGISIESKNIQYLEDILRSSNYKELLENIEYTRNNSYNLYKNAYRIYDIIEELL